METLRSRHATRTVRPSNPRAPTTATVMSTPHPQTDASRLSAKTAADTGPGPVVCGPESELGLLAHLACAVRQRVLSPGDAVEHLHRDVCAGPCWLRRDA